MIQMKEIRCSVCGELKPESSFPKNRLMDGTVKITGDVCCSCKSRQYRKKYKEEKEELRVVSKTDTLSVIDMIAKLNALGYVIIKREEYENMSTMGANLKTQEYNE
jgi:hypothetical protein